MAAQTSEFDREMSRLEAEIRRLEAEYNMFFAGRLPRLPWETRARVEALVKRYDQMHIQNTAQRFRFGTLQARYVAFRDLWERNLKAKEEGRSRRRPRAAAPATHAATSAPQAAPPAPKPSGPRVVASAAIRDPAHETERLKDLYERLSAARKEAGERPLSYESFAHVVRAQVGKLGGGSGSVAFQVAVQHGKVTLTAKPVKDAK
jgi:hypothetical protein